MTSAAHFKHIRHDRVHTAEVLAVQALDELVCQLLRTHKHLPSRFLDWVGVEATWVARNWVKVCMRKPEFARVIGTPQAELAIQRAVYRQVMPLVLEQLNNTKVQEQSHSALGQPGHGVR